MQANDEAVNSVVLSVNRGGLLVEVEHFFILPSRGCRVAVSGCVNAC